MSLLNVTVKCAKYVGEQASQLNTYVNIKVQNVKTTTQTIKGAEPVWNQDFLFETTATTNSGVVVEVWCKNIILDRALGFQYIPLDTLPFNQYEYPASYEQWFSIDADLVTINGEVQGTRDPTGHMILLDLHFELPYDVDTQTADVIQHNNKLNQNEQYIENYYHNQSSDYGFQHNNGMMMMTTTMMTNNQNYVVGQLAATATTPLSSLETSRQNSYEREERQYYDCNNYNNYNNSYAEEDEDIYEDAEDGGIDYDDGALYYNSRPMSSTNYNRPIHRTVRQLSKRNLERQNTLLYDEDQYEPAFDTCSELNYNSNYNGDDYYDSYGYQNNQQWQNGEFTYDSYNSCNKKLPQPPLSYSQSVNDGFGHRGASLPATPQRNRLSQSRQLPKHTPSPARGLPKLTRQLPSSIESAASTFSSLFSRNRKTTTPATTEKDHHSTYNHDQYATSTALATTNYNENYNYAYRSMDSGDELMCDDGDNNNLVNSRYGAALPTLPYGDYNNYNSEPTMEQQQQQVVPSIDVQYDNTSGYYNDDYYDIYHKSDQLTPSPKKSKRLPSPASSTAAHQTPSTPSIINAAGAGLSSLFSSLSHSLHSPAATTTATTTSNSLYGGYSTAAGTSTYDYKSYDYTKPSKDPLHDLKDSIFNVKDTLFGHKDTTTTSTHKENEHHHYGTDRTMIGVDSLYGPKSTSFDMGVSGEFTVTSPYSSYGAAATTTTTSSSSILNSYGVSTSSIFGAVTTTTSSSYGISASTYEPITSSYSYSAKPSSSSLFNTDAVSLTSYGLDTSSFLDKTSTYDAVTTTSSSLFSVNSSSVVSSSSYGLTSTSYGITTTSSSTYTSVFGSELSKYGIESSKYGLESSKYGLDSLTSDMSYSKPEVSLYDSTYNVSSSTYDVKTSIYAPVTSSYDFGSTSYGKNDGYDAEISNLTKNLPEMTTSIYGKSETTGLMNYDSSIYKADIYDTQPSSLTYTKADSTFPHNLSESLNYSKIDPITSSYGQTTTDSSIYNKTELNSSIYSKSDIFDTQSYSKSDIYDPISSIYTTSDSKNDSNIYNSDLTSSIYSKTTDQLLYDYPKTSSYEPITSSYDLTSKQSQQPLATVTSSYASISANLVNPYAPLKYDDEKSTPSITIAATTTATSTSSSSSSSIFSPLTNLFSNTSSSSSTISTSIYNSHGPSIGYGGSSTLGLLGHSPIPEEEDGEMLQEEEESEQFPPSDDYNDPYTLNGDYIEPFVPATQSYTSDGFTNYTTTDTYNTSILEIPTSAASMIHSMRRISDPYAYLSENIEEEYREDFEEGVMPITVTEPGSGSGDYDAYKSVMTTSSLQQNYSTYPLQSKLSTIHETSSDVYSDHNEHHFEDQITPTAYDYTENENDYIASGDLKNTNLMQNNNYAPYSTAPSTIAEAVTQQQQTAATGQKKSLFGSLFSGGLDVLGSSVNAVKATATNLAQTAVGAAGVAAGAAAGAVHSVKTSQNQSHNQNQIVTTSYQNVNSTSGGVQQNGPYAANNIYTTAANTLITPSDTQNANFNNNSRASLQNSKLTKQASSIYDQPEEDEFYDDTQMTNIHGTHVYQEDQDYFNEEDENRYLEEHPHSPDNNNYHHNSMMYSDNNNIYNNTNNSSSSNNNNNNNNNLRRNSSRKLERNDTNNNDGLLEVDELDEDEYEDEYGDYDRHHHHHQSTSSSSHKKQSIHDDDYYSKLNEDDVYAEEFEEHYGNTAATAAAAALASSAAHDKNVHKQMSISDDAQHHDDESSKALDDEYLDEFDEERISGIKHHDMSGGIGISGYMKKQESIMEDDPELKQLEEQQNLKNQQIQQQMQHPHVDDLLLDGEMKQKKSVTISDEEPIIHQKPMEKRTARQRWHWAYNRIVHQQQVSAKIFYHLCVT